MFSILLQVAFAVLTAYTAWRAASVRFVARRLSRRSVAVVAVGLFAAHSLAQLLGHDRNGPSAAVLEATGMTMLGTIFLVSMGLLAADVATGFGLVFPRWAPAARGAGMLAGAVLAAVAAVQGLRAPAVVRYDVTVAGLPAELDGRVLVALSDAHLGAQLGAAWLEARAAQIEAERPDLIVFLGDIFEGHGDGPRDLSPLRRLSAPLGKWFVEGNHESHRRMVDGPDLLEQAGFRRLSDEWAEPAPGLVLAGVEDLTSWRRRGGAGDPVSRTLSGRPAGATVLLSHTPWQADRAARAGVSLMLSGHTHGGQIWPFGYLVRLRYPLLAGRYQVEGMPIIVCRGTGTWGPPMRLWRRGEILRVTLRSGSPGGGPGRGDG